MTALTRHQGIAALILLSGALVSLSVCGQATHDPAPLARAQPGGLVQIPLIRLDSEEIPGDAAAKDFFVQLPEHVRFQAGCELRLALYPSLEVLSRLCTIKAWINGKPLSGAVVEGKNPPSTSDRAIRLRFPLPDGSLVPGWDRIALRFILKKPPAAGDAATGAGKWTILRSDSYLSVVYQRMPLFPELVRFPGSFAEEKLLHPPDSNADSAEPTLTLLVPTARRDAHLRACTVIGARLGQLGYLSAEDCRVAWLENWKEENQERNGIAVGVRDELTSLSLPPTIADKLASLQPGQGLIAEFITDAVPNQRRWLLLAGADDPGLEKAVLTLGSAPALAAAPPNPIIIDAMPSVSSVLEAATQPEARRVGLKDLGVSQVRLSGLHTVTQAVSGWRFPPGFDLASGVLDLQFSHSPTLLDRGSWLDVLVDGLKVGTIELTPKNAGGGSIKLALPKGFGGRDPMLLTFRAHLDISPVDCNRRKEDEPWLIISGDSTLEITASPMQVHGLNKFNRLLLRDRFLRRAALLVPRELSFAELPWLIAVSMHLGRQLPSSPVLWPDVCTYSRSSPPPPTRLEGRSILLLGSISQWETALPPEAPLLLRIGNARTGAVRLQGSEANIGSFELSLAFLQMMRSPWASGEWLVAAGSWHEFATPALLRLLTDPKITGELHGNICALDAGGRLAAYDSRSPAPDSLAERIHSRIPIGLSADETRELVGTQKAHLRRHDWINTVVFDTCGLVFGLIVGCRLLLMWERTYLAKKRGHEEPHRAESAS